MKHLGTFTDTAVHPHEVSLQMPGAENALPEPVIRITGAVLGAPYFASTVCDCVLSAKGLHIANGCSDAIGEFGFSPEETFRIVAAARAAVPGSIGEFAVSWVPNLHPELPF